MNGVTRQVFTDKIVRWGMTISGILILIHILLIAGFYVMLPPVVPLYNQLPWGDARLGSRIELLIPAVTTVLFYAFNFYLLTKLYNSMPLVARIISVTTSLLSMLGFIFIIRTLLLIL